LRSAARATAVSILGAILNRALESVPVGWGARRTACTSCCSAGHPPPDSIDIDLNVDIFTEASWQYVLYGMGYKTDLRPKAGVLKYYDEARTAFGRMCAAAHRAPARH